MSVTKPVEAFIRWWRLSETEKKRSISRASSKMHVISRKVMSIREKGERKKQKKGEKYRPVFACCLPDGRKKRTARGET